MDAAGPTLSQRALIKALWPSARSDSERVVRWAAERRLPRSALNIIYNRLSYRQMGRVHARFAKLFRDGESRVEPGTWNVRFRGRKMRIPLGKDTMWLDWDSALSVLGHEPEIKTTYASYVEHFGCPRCVFDVGANYGLHSLLFLVHDVDVVSFEPNPACHGYLERLGEVNGVSFRIESSALGSGEGTLTLSYPERDTWLGTVRPERAREMAPGHALRRLDVPCESLDAYVRRSGKVPDLVKLDTEGNEHQVLLGAADTLRNDRPSLIFECWPSRERSRIWQLLADLGYDIVRLPLQAPSRVVVIGVSEFADDPGTNFAGLARELLRR